MSYCIGWTSKQTGHRGCGSTTFSFLSAYEICERENKRLLDMDHYPVKQGRGVRNVISQGVKYIMSTRTFVTYIVLSNLLFLCGYWLLVPQNLRVGVCLTYIGASLHGIITGWIYARLQGNNNLPPLEMPVGSIVNLEQDDKGNCLWGGLKINHCAVVDNGQSDELD